MTPIPRIQQIRERLEKATKGTWRVEPELDSEPEDLQNVMTDAGGVEPIISCLSNIPDAAFIAHSREDVEYLLNLAEAGAELARAIDNDEDIHIAWDNYHDQTRGEQP
jgi:hypothetical protein